MNGPALATIWGGLAAEAARLKRRSLRRLFAEDPDRFARLSYRLDDLLIDFSREKVDAEALAALLELARARGVEAARDAMAAGEVVNVTERRPARHMALRSGADPVLEAGLSRFLDFAEAVRGGAVAPVGGGRFTDVVNIGIGGSDLGPAMTCEALRPDADGPRTHFLSNVDGAHFVDTLSGLNPATTLAIVASKSMHTAETRANAETFRDWLAAGGVADPAAHLCAVSANPDAAALIGARAERCFLLPDWVGGRLSIWSAVGLPLAIAIGAGKFRAFLAGARAMDAHFLSAPLAENLPVLMALIGVWRRNLMDLPTVAVVPYAHRLARFPAYLQQLEMESNGKGVDAEGRDPGRATGAVVWGEPGTNAQHSFFQLLHQGTDVIPVDFIAAVEAREDVAGRQNAMLANCLAQSRALAFGWREDEAVAAMRAEDVSEDDAARLAPHRASPGDRPSTTILQQRVDPASLGRLIALYEHKVFVQGVIWGIDSFDQWGVELGKTVAREIAPALDGDKAGEGLDSATRGLIAEVLARRKTSG